MAYPYQFRTCSGLPKCLLWSAKERWLELCEQAAVEQDPKKLTNLVTEIDRLLDEKRRRLQRRSLMDATRAVQDQKVGGEGAS
jgi:hypothetical protein